jgi:hypothetical protein
MTAPREMTATPLNRVPPSEYLASLISDLLVQGTEGDETPRVVTQARSRQAARVIATFCAPVRAEEPRVDCPLCGAALEKSALRQWCSQFGCPYGAFMAIPPVAPPAADARPLSYDDRRDWYTDGQYASDCAPDAAADADLTALAEAARRYQIAAEAYKAQPVHSPALWVALIEAEEAYSRAIRDPATLLALLAARDEARAQVDLLAAERRELAEQVDAMSASLAKAEGERDALELVVIKAVTHLDTVAHDAAHRGDQDDEAIELAGLLTAALPTTRRDGA